MPLRGRVGAWGLGAQRTLAGISYASCELVRSSNMRLCAELTGARSGMWRSPRQRTSREAIAAGWAGFAACWQCSKVSELSAVNQKLERGELLYSECFGGIWRRKLALELYDAVTEGGGRIWRDWIGKWESLGGLCQQRGFTRRRFNVSRRASEHFAIMIRFIVSDSRV